MTDSDNSRINPADKIKPFERRFWDGADTFTKIGNGAIGGKASGLALVRDILARRFQREQFPSLELNVPTLTVITTEFYDRFMQDNNLYGEILRDYRDDQIALIFQRGELAPELVGDLRALISNFHTPLAIRSSSLLEDAMREPFAGVYGTKMIPNNQPETDTRFQRLVEAIKFVYASTHFRKARNYLKSTRRAPSAEKMAVIIQEVVGRRHNGRFYPDISGVARSINHYPTGHATPEQGVVSLALGLGKTIVDGGQVWSYAPSYPRATPPVRSLANLAKMSQATFWAVNMGKPPAHDPIKETEYLVRLDLKDAEWDGTLALTASTYQPQNDRLVTGIGQEGIRVVTFAPLLSARLFPLNDLLRHLLQVSAEETGSDIEMEFAMTFSRENNSVKCRLGYLQLRPMATRDKEISLSNAEMQSEKVIVRSSQVMGNGIIEGITDIIYVKPEMFKLSETPRIAEEVELLDRRLAESERPYLLIGFGRWGSSEPWLGIPVDWSQISGARAIVEAILPDVDIEPSQGSHFFHNLVSFQVCYLTVQLNGEDRIDFDFLSQQQALTETTFIRHIRIQQPLVIKVDGRRGRGIVYRNE
jgi:hypothetical protein